MLDVDLAGARSSSPFSPATPAGPTTRRSDMSDITVMWADEFDTPNGGGFCRARASLGVSAFGMQVEQFPPNFLHHPEHDHADDGQEEVYTVLSGSATLRVGDEQHRLAPGVFALLRPGGGRASHV